MSSRKPLQNLLAGTSSTGCMVAWLDFLMMIAQIRDTFGWKRCMGWPRLGSVYQGYNEKVEMSHTSTRWLAKSEPYGNDGWGAPPIKLYSSIYLPPCILCRIYMPVVLEILYVYLLQDEMALLMKGTNRVVIGQIGTLPALLPAIGCDSNFCALQTDRGEPG